MAVKDERGRNGERREVEKDGYNVVAKVIRIKRWGSVGESVGNMGEVVRIHIGSSAMILWYVYV